jgi:hypothetical protein
VENFRLQSEHLKEIPADRIFEVSRDKHLEPADMLDFVLEVRDNAGKILAAGTDVLHLFYGGPAAAAAIVGAEFANACRVILYQYDHGRYGNFGPLRADSAA